MKLGKLFDNQTAYADGVGGLIIKTESDLTNVLDATKEAFNLNSGKTGWGDNPIDRRNHIAHLPNVIIDELNKKGIMRGFHILDQKAMKAWLNDSNNAAFRMRGGRV